jgi:hypothetical protein
MGHGRSNRFRLFVGHLAILFLLSVSGCGGQTVTKAQADRIKAGYSVSEVENILGKGKVLASNEVERLVKASFEAGAAGQDSGAASKIAMDFSDLRGIKWGSEKKYITVVFQNGRVFRVFTQGL